MRPLAVAVLFIAAFALGYLSRLALVREDVHVPSNTSAHWQTLDRYLSEIEGAGEAREVDGMVGFSTEADPYPALAALTSSGELEHVDLVLPVVPKSTESNNLWMQYAAEHPDIIYIEGNPEYSDFPTAGSAPLHLNIWFRKSAKAQVRELVEKLEQLGGEGT